MSRLIACGLALTAFVLTAARLALDRVAAAEDVSESGAWWLYPFLLAAIPAMLIWVLAVSVAMWRGQR